ncbi:MAG: hypothetical protein WAK12_07435 [Acidimicrobiales bacterium]
MARVGLVPSPIGPRRYGVTIDAVFDEELLHQSDKLTFTKKAGGVGGRYRSFLVATLVCPDDRSI